MNSNSEPSGSRKYTLKPGPPAPLRGGAGPDQAEVGHAGRGGDARDGRRVHARAVDVEHDVAEAVAPAARAVLGQLDQLGAADVAVEGVGALPVRDGDHHVVEGDAISAAGHDSQ
jgi:hypothetical protein